MNFNDLSIEDGFDFALAFGKISKDGLVSIDFSSQGGFKAPFASVTKLVTALALLVAVDDESVSPEDEVLQGKCVTVASLLSHSSGITPDGVPSLTAEDHSFISPVGRRRIYSNLGYEILALHLEQVTSMRFQDYVMDAVIVPAGMKGTNFSSEHFVNGGNGAATGLVGTVDDLVMLVEAMTGPKLLSYRSLSLLSTPYIPGISGVLPGFGLMKDNQWGLGAEIRDSKSPHWSGVSNSRYTYGHFGRSGSLVWVDPEIERFMVFLSSRDFGSWSKELWPKLSEYVAQLS